MTPLAATATPISSSSKPLVAPSSAILTPFEFNKFVRAFRSPTTTTTKPVVVAKENQPNFNGNASKSTDPKKSILNHLSTDAATPQKNYIATSTPKKTITTTAAIKKRTPKRTPAKSAIKDKKESTSEASDLTEMSNTTPFKPRKVLQRTPPKAIAVTTTSCVTEPVAPASAPDAAPQMPSNAIVAAPAAAPLHQACHAATVTESKAASPRLIVPSPERIFCSSEVAGSSSVVIPDDNIVSEKKNHSLIASPVASILSVPPAVMSEKPTESVLSTPEPLAAADVSRVAVSASPQSLSTCHTADIDAHSAVTRNASALMAAASLHTILSSVATLTAKLKAREASTFLLNHKAELLCTLAATISTGTGMTPTRSVTVDTQTSPICMSQDKPNREVEEIAMSSDEIAFNDDNDMEIEEAAKVEENAEPADIVTKPMTVELQSENDVPHVTANNRTKGMTFEAVLRPVKSRAKMPFQAKPVLMNEPNADDQEIPTAEKKDVIVAVREMRLEPSRTTTAESIVADVVIEGSSNNAEESEDSVDREPPAAFIPHNMHLELLPTRAKKSKPTTISNIPLKQKKSTTKPSKKEAERAENPLASNECVPSAPSTAVTGFESFYASMLPIVTAQQPKATNIAAIIEGMWEVMTSEEKQQWLVSNDGDSKREEQTKRKRKKNVTAEPKKRAKPDAKAASKSSQRKKDTVFPAANDKGSTNINEKGCSDKKLRAIAYCKQVASTYSTVPAQNAASSTSASPAVNSSSAKKLATRVKMTKNSRSKALLEPTDKSQMEYKQKEDIALPTTPIAEYVHFYY